MSAQEGQSSDSHIHMDPAIHPQDSRNPLVTTGFDACERALFLLGNLSRQQEALPRPAALAWERAAFAEVFDHPDPGLRIRRFLDKG
jgi:hypothetical protein